MYPLILIPTEMERKLFLRYFGQYNLPDDAKENHVVELCGFGPIVAAARTAGLIAKHNPSHCLHVGIAGTYSSELEIGTAAIFSSVGSYGVGVGVGEKFQTAGQMGWLQWPESGCTDSQNKPGSIGDSLELCLPDRTSSEVANQLLTVTSAATCSAEVNQRRTLFPNAVAEDMEGFGVAAACKLANVSLTIVRGFSNLAGDRNHANWQIETAMKATVDHTFEMLKRGSGRETTMAVEVLTDRGRD